jgi:hypothetical protein
MSRYSRLHLLAALAAAEHLYSVATWADAAAHLNAVRNLRDRLALAGAV